MKVYIWYDNMCKLISGKCGNTNKNISYHLDHDRGIDSSFAFPNTNHFSGSNNRPVLSMTPPNHPPAIFVGRFIQMAMGGIKMIRTTVQTCTQAII